MKKVHLSYQKNLGPHLRIEEQQFRWVILEEIADHCPKWLDYLHCKSPEWLSDITMKVRWGPVDEDGWTEKSLNYKLYRFADWVYSGFGAWKHVKHIGNVPLTVYEVHDLFPDADPIFTGDSEDAMNSQPKDEGEVSL